MGLFDFLKPKEQPVDVSTEGMRHSITGANAMIAAGDAFKRGSVATPHLDRIAHRELLIGKALCDISEAYLNAQDAASGTGEYDPSIEWWENL